ncbi:DUF4364 family protein [Clostridium manihotivorum]|uniref:DUF4364 domain-containing protein n=1 Tax=Clostridium manihotivorum TaxID=2320868 RepID=A0A410DSD6_9CLOT|nr:DUF4364 family protein [Clostridium manihotivorum]QAA31957.1 DUF4364 domain-containing protein [Clostridium manihotivorum]
MNDNTLELAENKLLLLYIIKSIKYPISNAQLTEIVLENSFINYFFLQQYITELISSGFIKYEASNDKKLLYITDTGNKVLTLFKDRISPQRLSLIDDYLKSSIEKIKRELTISADYTPDQNNTFIVNLRAVEDDSLLMDLKISVASKKQAIALCSKWKENPSLIYNNIINILIEEK